MILVTGRTGGIHQQNPAGVIRRDWCGLIVHLFEPSSSRSRPASSSRILARGSCGSCPQLPTVPPAPPRRRAWGEPARARRRAGTSAAKIPGGRTVSRYSSAVPRRYMSAESNASAAMCTGSRSRAREPGD